MSFYIDNNNYCIGKLCLNIDSKGLCEHVVLNQGMLELWGILKIRTKLGHKIPEITHFSANKIPRSTSYSNNIKLEIYKNT